MNTAFGTDIFAEYEHPRVDFQLMLESAANGIQHVDARRLRRGGFGFATAFGVTGYLLMRYAPLTTLSDILIAAAVGVAGAVGALTLVAAWAIPAAKAEVVDERYLLQGAFARVTAVSERGMSGTVVYESEGRSHTARAAPLEGCRLEVGGDVVIERIEDNVAYVEPWARVEARL